MKINKRWTSFIAAVAFFAGSSCGDGKGNVSTVTVTPIKPEEVFSQEQKEDLKQAILSKVPLQFNNLLKQHIRNFCTKLEKDFPSADDDEKLMSEILKKRLFPFFDAIVSILESSGSDPENVKYLKDILEENKIMVISELQL
jgi:hypothetical protein